MRRSTIHTRGHVMRGKCKHCERRVANHTRGLCRPCADTPGVRAMYPKIVAHTYRRGSGTHNTPTQPTSATDEPAGSVGKIEVMRARAEAGESVFHPGDSVEIRPEPKR